MRRHITSTFDRWWQELDPSSVIRLILAPIIGLIFIVKMILSGIFVLVVLYQIARFPSAWNRVARAFHEALAHGQTDHDLTRLKGGEHESVGKRRGFLIRSGGPLNSDDLRRRLYELRASQQERKHQRTPKKGGQNG